MSRNRYEHFETRTRRRGYGASGQRTTFGYWVPLIITVSAATIGLAAWLWSERHDDDDDDYPDADERSVPPPVYGDLGPGETSYGRGVQSMDLQSQHAEDESVIARMSGALRRTPSPQEIFDGASRKVAAGVAAAGTMIGGALASIKEEDRRDYEDHSRWSEEAESRGNSGAEFEATSRGAFGAATTSTPYAAPQKRKTVAIVVSSVAAKDGFGEEYGTYEQEHASILAHLPEYVDTDTARVFVLIYAPGLKQHPLDTSPSSRPVPSMTSSFSNIGHEEARTPGEEGSPLATLDPQPVEESSFFKTLYRQAEALVEKETMIIPFTTPTGHVHLLRHLGPEVVYIQESLCGPDGDVVKHISGWVRQVVVVVGDEGGHGGLIDSEDEVGLASHQDEKWWQKSDRVGLGKGVEVVDGIRAGEDWQRRITGHD